MNTSSTVRRGLTILGFALTGFAGFQVSGQTFQFGGASYPPDVLLGFRQTGGAYEMLVDLGPVTRFTQATPGATLTIGDYSNAQLSSAFNTLDGVGFTVSAGVTDSGSTNAAGPTGAVWVTRKRASVSTQSTAWKRQGEQQLLATANVIVGMGRNAVQIGGAIPAGSGNTNNLIVEQAGTPGSYGENLGTGNFRATFQGNAENVASYSFVEDSQTIWSDFYQILPGTGASTYLGYFTFTSAGVLTFTAAGGMAAPAPSITGISQAAGATTVTFTSVANAEYTLLRSATLTPQISGWTAVGSAVVGTGSPVSITDSSSGTSAFYAVKATP